ncbi:predicted protein [Streptomyces sp. SPB78]|nr:predicted protein [Streptomyces sp. SPB78]
MPPPRPPVPRLPGPLAPPPEREEVERLGTPGVVRRGGAARPGPGGAYPRRDVAPVRQGAAEPARRRHVTE